MTDWDHPLNWVSAKSNLFVTHWLPEEFGDDYRVIGGVLDGISEVCLYPNMMNLQELHLRFQKNDSPESDHIPSLPVESIAHVLCEEWRREIQVVVWLGDTVIQKSETKGDNMARRRRTTTKNDAEKAAAAAATVQPTESPLEGLTEDPFATLAETPTTSSGPVETATGLDALVESVTTSEVAAAIETVHGNDPAVASSVVKILGHTSQILEKLDNSLELKAVTKLTDKLHKHLKDVETMIEGNVAAILQSLQAVRDAVADLQTANPAPAPTTTSKPRKEASAASQKASDMAAQLIATLREKRAVMPRFPKVLDMANPHHAEAVKQQVEQLGFPMRVDQILEELEKAGVLEGTVIKF